MAENSPQSPIRKSTAAQYSSIHPSQPTLDPQLLALHDTEEARNNSTNVPPFRNPTVQELHRSNEQLERKIGDNPRQHSELIWTVIYPIVALLITVIFGLFSVFASFDSRKANDLSEIANKIAILSFCHTVPNNASYNCNDYGSDLFDDIVAETFKPWHQSDWTSRELAGIILVSCMAGLAFFAMCRDLKHKYKGKLSRLIERRREIIDQ